MTEEVLAVLSVIGTLAFAVSGAMIAIGHRMDVFGVAVLGMMTAVGGGIVRDLMLGYLPVRALREPVYPILALAAALLVFLAGRRGWHSRREKAWELLLLVSDSAGLGAFTVMGVRQAHAVMGQPNLFTCAFMGVVTGVFGGVLRDVFAWKTPDVFVKHFDACASLAGALACALLWGAAGEVASMVAGACLTFALRIAAAKYRWNLPKAG